MKSIPSQKSKSPISLSPIKGELDELRNAMQKKGKRDAKGIQTLFRTTSRNHYTLNQMVDRKANIMITVNAIILTVMISGILGTPTADYGSAAALLLSLASILSIVFAVVSITPNRTQGRFTEEEVRNKKGNLLYYGNFHRMSLEDYEWGMLQKLNDSDYLYRSMIKDLYYLGQVLQHKYRFIRYSLIVFITGLVLAFMVFVVGYYIHF